MVDNLINRRKNISKFFLCCIVFFVSFIVGLNIHYEWLTVENYNSCNQDDVEMNIAAIDQGEGTEAAVNATKGMKAENNVGDSKSEKPHLQSLQCEAYGGPSDDVASEMVYWWKIPSDEHFLNSFQKENLEKGEEKYLIFEADSAGWNNIRMSLETIITLAIAMGR